MNIPNLIKKAINTIKIKKIDSDILLIFKDLNIYSSSK